MTTFATCMLSAPGRKPHVDAVEFVLQISRHVPEAVLERVERHVDDVVRVLHLAALAGFAGLDAVFKDADDFQPRIVSLDEFADAWPYPSSSTLALAPRTQTGALRRSSSAFKKRPSAGCKLWMVAKDGRTP